MSSENYITNVAKQVSLAREQGATKVVLDAESVEGALEECQQLVGVSDVLSRLGGLALDSSDIDVLSIMESLCDDLIINSSHVSESDEQLLQDFKRLVTRIMEADLAVESDEDYLGNHEDMVDEEESPSSFRGYDSPSTVSENFDIPVETSVRSTWLTKILGR